MIAYYIGVVMFAFLAAITYFPEFKILIAIALPVLLIVGIIADKLSLDRKRMDPNFDPWDEC